MGPGARRGVADRRAIPMVYADWLHAEGAPTVLVYGHYDVQPVDPLDLWVRPPFEPRIEDGRIYARGAADDKGQVHIHLWAARAWLETARQAARQRALRVRGRGGVRLGQLRRLARGQPRPAEGGPRGHQRHRLLRGQPAGHHGRPAGPDVRPDRRHRDPTVDLHSGTCGGNVQNPAIALAQHHRRRSSATTAACTCPASTTRSGR